MLQYRLKLFLFALQPMVCCELILFELPEDARHISLGYPLVVHVTHSVGDTVDEYLSQARAPLDSSLLVEVSDQDNTDSTERQVVVEHTPQGVFRRSKYIVWGADISSIASRISFGFSLPSLFMTSRLLLAFE